MLKTIVTLFAGAAVLLLGGFALSPLFHTETLGGGGFETYSYRHITGANASSTAGVQIRGGAGVLGAITIASSSPLVASGIRIYDGTTATSSGVLIGKIRTSASEQTFEFNAAVKSGIILDVPVGFDGSLIVNYR